MTKNVVSTSMVAHLWANQSQAWARNSGSSCSFDGPVIFSYRTPVAMLHDTKKAGRVCLITSDGYSMTTKSRHLPEIRRAVHSSQVYHVPYVGAFGGWAPSRADKPADWHALNVLHLVHEYNDLGARLKRARWIHYTSAADIEAALTEAASTVKAYCYSFGLKVPALDPADDARVIWGTHERRKARANDPAQAAKRERAKARAEERKAEREAAERAEQFRRTAEARAAFRAGAPRNYGRVSCEHGGALLRVNGDTVQTSWGAEVPADDARRAFPFIARARERGEIWSNNRETLGGFKLGSFALNEIRADGSIRAGCHTIYWPELEACARALGLVS